MDSKEPQKATIKRKPYVIAEIGQAHDGSLGFAHSYIDAVSHTGVDAIKFQMHIADAESGENDEFRVNFSRQDESRYHYWKRMEFSFEQWLGLKKHSEESGLEFIVSPFSMAAVECLRKLELKTYKIGSGEVNNYLMLSQIAEQADHVLLSTGMSTYDEIEGAVACLQRHTSNITLFQCTTNYPTTAFDLGLNVLAELKSRYDLAVGLSDHSGKIFASLAAAALGVDALEVHVVFDKRMFGPDTLSSITLDELSQLVEGVSYINTALSNPVDKNDISRFLELRRMFGKSLSAASDLNEGDELNRFNVETKKPAGLGMCPAEYERVLGKKLTRAKMKGDFIREEDLA